MARQPTEKHKHKRKYKHKHEAVDAQVKRKSAKSSHAHRHSNKDVSPDLEDIQDLEKQPKGVKKPSKSQKSAQHPAKEPEGVKKSSKPTKIVSAANLFKQAKHDKKKHRKRKEPTPEPTLTDYLQEGIEEGIEHARTSIDHSLNTAFSAQHEEFIRQLKDQRAADEAFFHSIFQTATALSAPLAEEQIETTFTRDGKRVTEIVEIGKRIELFKKSVEREEGKLKGYWKAWEDVQDEYEELGMEVFGPEMFERPVKDARESGFAEEMEGLDKEHDAQVAELTSEVGGLAGEYLTKMKDSEK
ncbi:hypothetical protein D0Z07_7731, partial [Hyphodiscus hymeniophilus]